MAKIGRNDLCPCGSGNKFKKCHGVNNFHQSHQEDAALSLLLQRKQAQEYQRQKQQGLGRQIISTEIKGTRFVAVGRKLLYGKRWNTFIDFLGEYIRIILDPTWGNDQIKNKSDDQRHPILKWYQMVCNQQSKKKDSKRGLYSMPITGAVKAYYGLAYDLYCLEHNAELQSALIQRLKNPDLNFSAVRYEIAVAAIMIRGGFEIEFEDEKDRRTTHCEFTATSSRTGKKFSVECKRLESSPGDGLINLSKLGKRFSSALKKMAHYQRIVFIDLNFPWDPEKNKTAPSALDIAVNHINKFELNVKNGDDLPPAFVILTNNPLEHHLDKSSIGFAAALEGFKIPDYKTTKPYPLQDAIIAREKYSDIAHLFESLEVYKEIPTTFDGEMPEFAFNKDLSKSRLLIGERYLIPDGQREVIAVLEQAIFVESFGAAIGTFRTQEGKSLMVRCPLTDEEIRAYKSHPETFFGSIDRNVRKSGSALDLYDFFLSAYQNTPKDTLLNLLQNHPNYDDFEHLSSIELAKIYAQHCVEHAIGT